MYFVTLKNKTISKYTICNRMVILLATLCGLLTTTCQPIVQDNIQLPTSLPPTDPTLLQLQTFDELWKTVEPNYIFVEETNFDWQVTYNQFREKIVAGITNEEFNSLIDDLIKLFPRNTLIYRDRMERIHSDLQSTLSYEGIGAYISVVSDPIPHIVILSIIPSSPAEKAGLFAHDSIYAIDDNPITSEEGLEVVNRVRGTANSKVKLLVKSPGSNERIVQVTREKVIGIDMVRYTYLPLTRTGLIRIPMNGNYTILEDTLIAIEDLKNQHNIKNLIIDIRIAHSNINWPLNQMLGLFSNGNMGTIYNRQESYDLIIDTQDTSQIEDIPLIILIGRDTKGYSEIFADALQKKGRAKLIGETTHGQMHNFDHFILPNGGEIFFSSSSYRDLYGNDIGISSVIPDIAINARWDEISDKDNFRHDTVVTRAELEFNQ